MNKNIVFTAFALSFILVASLAIITSKQMASAIDLPSIKQKATNLLNSNYNDSSTNNNSTTTSSPTSNSTSTSSLKQQATNAIGSLLK
jgi:signal transduction histidine kinase